jgi:hypothetical protein
MHNALQGAERTLTDHEKEIYLTYSIRNARLLEEQIPDRSRYRLLYCRRNL